MNISARIVAVVAVALCFSPVGAGQQRVFNPDRMVCSINSIPYLPFGTYDPFQPVDLTVQNQFSIRCEPVTRGSARPLSTTRATRRREIKIEVSISEGFSGTFSHRTMRGPQGEVVYNIYSDTACTEVWGDGSRGTDTYQARFSTDQAFTETLIVFGKMPAGQSVHGGVYYDLLVVTIDY